MRTRAQIAADLASAAARRLTEEIEQEPAKSAKVAKTTARNQLLEAAYNFATGNVPILTEGGWIIRSKSTTAGTLVHLKVGNLEIKKFGKDYAINGEIFDTGSVPVECELQIAQGKPYCVSLNADSCTCDGAQIPGKMCWHICAVEFWAEAGRMFNENKGSFASSTWGSLSPLSRQRRSAVRLQGRSREAGAGRGAGGSRP